MAEKSPAADVEAGLLAHLNSAGEVPDSRSFASSLGVSHLELVGVIKSLSAFRIVESKVLSSRSFHCRTPGFVANYQTPRLDSGALACLPAGHRQGDMGAHRRGQGLRRQGLPRGTARRRNPTGGRLQGRSQGEVFVYRDLLLDFTGGFCFCRVLMCRFGVLRQNWEMLSMLA